jgi:ubiquinone/menaquinone biosynthesis C-methylase UbiE
MAERAHPDDAGFQDGFFGLKPNRYKRKLIERYRRCNELVAGKTLLDIPCGTGWGTSLLRGYRFAWGIDIAEDAIEFAKSRYERKGKLEFRVGRMEQIALADDAVEVLLCLEGFEHVTREAGSAFVTEAKRVLKRDGALVLTCPVLDERGKDSGNPHHLYEYPEHELIQTLNDNFRIERLERFQGPDGPEYRAVCKNFKDVRYISG